MRCRTGCRDGSLVDLTPATGSCSIRSTSTRTACTLRGVEFDYKTPRYHNYNVTLQTEIMPNHSLEVGYVGTRGRNLETFTGMNNVTRLLPPGTNPQQYVQWPDFARGSLFVRTVGVSSYDSLQTKFQRRYHRGLEFLVSYTLSDSKTNAGDSLSGGGVGGLRAPDVVGWDLENDIGLSGFHTKHALVFSGNYDLPGKGAILGGWRTNWVLSIYSGQAQTINCSITTRRRDGLLRARRRRSVCGQPRREPVLQPGGVREPARRSRRSGRPTSARSAVRAARSPVRRCGSSTWASRGSSASVGAARSSRSASRSST